MDPKLEIILERQPPAFQPGESVAGSARWLAGHEPGAVSLRLFWSTSGKGTTDLSLVESRDFARPRATDDRPFAFILPAGPPSFSGTLISLVWGLELVMENPAAAVSVEIICGPQGRELLLPKIEPHAAAKPPWWKPVANR
jgi:hypothetical protein